jgi:hypothetical protein
MCRYVYIFFYGWSTCKHFFHGLRDLHTIHINITVPRLVQPNNFQLCHSSLLTAASHQLTAAFLESTEEPKRPLRVPRKNVQTILKIIHFMSVFRAYFIQVDRLSAGNRI